MRNKRNILHEFCSIFREKSKQTQFKITALDDRDNSDDAAYWERYPLVLSDKSERLWDALLEGLEKYRYNLH